MISDIKFSLFHSDKGLKNLTPLKHIGVAELKRVIFSSKLMGLSFELDKLSLPYITAYGTFSARFNDKITSFNNNIIALDYDGLTSFETSEIFETLQQNKSTLLVFISPSGCGVKALIYCPHKTKAKDLYNTLKYNVERIKEALNIANDIDTRQFVLSQALFLYNRDSNIHFNETPEPLNLELEEPPVYTPPKPIKVDLSSVNDRQKSRIETYLINALKYTTDDLSAQSKGTRHSSIMKIQGIKNLLHYAPHLEDDFKSSLLFSVIQMYGSQKEAERNNAINSFNRAWETTTPIKNATIEQILSEL